MKLLREYIRELLLRESDEAETDERGYIIGADGKKYNPKGRNQWELPYQFKKSSFSSSNIGLRGQIRYFPDEDGTYNIKPPSPIPAKWDGFEGYVYHDAFGSLGSEGAVKYGGTVPGVEGLHAGQSAKEHSERDDGSIVVVHPELWNNPTRYTWFTRPEGQALYAAAVEKLSALGEGPGLIRKLQAFAIEARDPDSEWAKKLIDSGALTPNTLDKTMELFIDNGNWFAKQAKSARKGAEMQGISFELFRWLGAYLENEYSSTSSGDSDQPVLLEFLDLFDEYEKAPKPSVEEESDAIAVGKDLAIKLGNGMHVVEFAKAFAKMWRKLRISSREEIKEFMRYARGNRDDGYPDLDDLLSNTDGYTVPDEAYAALARLYYD